MHSADDDLVSDVEPDYRRLLVQAAELYGKAESARVPAIFLAVRAALVRLKQTEKVEYLRPLALLLQDLDLLNSGKPAKILKPRKDSAIYPDRADGASIVRQAYALAVQRTLFTGYGPRCQGKADRDAAKILSSLGYKTRAGHLVTANILRQWRPLLGRQEAEFGQLQHLYRRLENLIPAELTESEARECAAALARSIANQPGFDLS